MISWCGSMAAEQPRRASTARRAAGGKKGRASAASAASPSPTPLAPGELHPLVSQSLAFAIVTAIIYVVQKFLFPLEDYWLLLVPGLLAYTLAQWLLLKWRRSANLFIALDRGDLRTVDALIPLVGPVVIAGALSAAGWGLFIFLCPAFWVICILHACMAAIVEHLLLLLRRRHGLPSGVQGRTWLASIGFAVLIFSVAFFSLDTWQPIQPRLTGDPAVRGIWFTIPVQKSDLFALGYARLEDSVFDDLGRIFVAEVGQSVGLVEACEVPGPDVSRAVVAPVPGVATQPKFNYAVDAMCPNWIATLPGFFWQIGLVGILLLVLVIGIYGFRDPIDLGILSVILLFGWATWPAPARERMGNVAVLVAGMPLIALIFPLFRRRHYSFLVMWGLLSGVLFGLAAFVRRPCGLALAFTSVAALIYLGIRQRKLGLALVASLALLAGSSLVPATLNGLFLYRDARLQISAPRISPLVHGSGFPLLGGAGGQPIGDETHLTPQYPNSLDIAFLDGPIWYVVYNTNPMIGFAQRSFTLMQSTSQGILLRYIAAHPLQYLRTSLRKTIAAIVLILNVPANWPAASLLLFGLLALRYILLHRSPAETRVSGERMLEMLAAFMVLALIAAVPAVLTSPDYGESAQLPAAVVFFTILAAIQQASRILAFKADPT